MPLPPATSNRGRLQGSFCVPKRLADFDMVTGFQLVLQPVGNQPARNTFHRKLDFRPPGWGIGHAVAAAVADAVDFDIHLQMLACFEATPVAVGFQRKGEHIGPTGSIFVTRQITRDQRQVGLMRRA